MRHLREIFRQKFELRRSRCHVAQSFGLSAWSVASAMSRKACGLDWGQIQTLGDEVIEERLGAT
jgi:hypothetical protein